MKVLLKTNNTYFNLMNLCIVYNYYLTQMKHYYRLHYKDGN